MSSRPDGNEGAAPAAPFDPFTESWRLYELAEGESVAGEVVRLPERGAFNGSRLFLRRSDTGEVLAIRATAKVGHTVLEKKLVKMDIQVGDHVRVAFQGWAETGDGFPYRHEEVNRIG